MISTLSYCLQDEYKIAYGKLFQIIKLQTYGKSDFKGITVIFLVWNEMSIYIQE